MSGSVTSRSRPGDASPPIVGRAAEFALLEEQLALARSGRTALVILGGEAGIGKTTLARGLAAHARDIGCQVLVGHSHDLMASPPYGPWLAMLDRLNPDVEAWLPPVPAVFAGDDLVGVTSQVEVFAQVREFLRALSASAPLLVVLEDAQWADPASIDLLRYLATHGEHIPMLLLVTYRADDLTRESPFYRLLPALIRETDGVRLDVRPLTAVDIRELVEARYALAPDDAERLVDYLVAHAEGNPFFASEILRALEAEGEDGLHQHGERWCLAAIDRFIVPALVRQVIESRVARLGETARDALAVAAVIGHEVPLGLWSRVSGLDEPTLLDIVDGAVERALLVAVPDGLHVQFVHAITREAFYQGILPPRRRLVHGAVAAALQKGPRINPEPIAYHLQQAGDRAAPLWLSRAGERAQRAYAWLTARDRFMAAANLLADLPDETLIRARLLYRCGRLLRYADAAQGIADLELAARLAEQGGDRVLLADARYSLGLLRCFADDWVTGLERMRAGIEELEGLPPAVGRASWSMVAWMADALPLVELPADTEVDPAAGAMMAAGISHRRGGLPWFLAAAGHLDASRAESDRFLAHAAEVDAGSLALSATGHAEFGQAQVLALTGKPEDARAAFTRAREIYRRLDHHAVIAFTWLTELNDLALPYAATDIAGRTRIATEAALALERAGGALPTGLSSRRAWLPLLALEGRWNDALALAAQPGTHGTYVLRRQVTRALAPIALHQGDTATAWAQVREILPQDHESRPGSAVLRDALLLQEIAVDLCLGAGEHDTARSWLAAHGEWLDWSGATLGQAGHELAAARVMHAAGDLEAAMARAATAVALAGEPRQPLALLAARRTLGHVLLDRGDPAAAARELDEALALADACAAPFERALVLEAMARVHLHDSGARASTLAAEARAILVPLGAAPALGRVDKLVARLGGSAAPAPIPGGLTARELDVLRLTAEGLTDGEIAERLFISSRTVSQHLRSVYGKLGLRTRAAATRYAIEHGLA